MIRNSLPLLHQKILQELEDAQTVSVLVRVGFRTVIGGFIHLALTLGGSVVVTKSQQEQSLL